MAIRNGEQYVGPTLKRSELPETLDFESKVYIFHDRVCGWQLEPGLTCYKIVPDGGFGALYITLSYFEMIERFRVGSIDHEKAGSKFRAGFRNFAEYIGFAKTAEYKKIRELLYAGARCGLYHVGMTKEKVFIGGGRAAIFEFDPNSGRLVIDPGQLIEAMLQHFKKYISDLMKPSETILRRNFLTKFDHDILSQIK